jgi:CRP/FNR family cyclic AMP-dependent transcriptional regulator
MADQITSVAREFSSARPLGSSDSGQTLRESASQGNSGGSYAERPITLVTGRPFDPKAFLGQVDHGRTKSRYKKKQIVFSQGDEADAVFYVQSGKVKTTVLSRHGKQAVTAILGNGDFFGEGCLAGQLKRRATVAALTECVVVRIEKAAIIRVLRDRPTFAEMFISHLMARNIRIEEDLLDQLFNSSEMRLARTLLLMADMGKDNRSSVIIPRISHETLAEMIGTTRARVSFFMNKFRKLGFISYKGKLQVYSSLLNVVLDTNHRCNDQFS